MARPAEQDPQWRGVAITTSIPTAWYVWAKTNGIMWRDIIRAGVIALKEPTETQQMIKAQEMKIQALERKLSSIKPNWKNYF